MTDEDYGLIGDMFRARLQLYTLAEALVTRAQLDPGGMIIIGRHLRGVGTTLIRRAEDQREAQRWAEQAAAPIDDQPAWPTEPCP